MNIQELRIGNYIYDVHNRVSNIVTIGNGTIRLSSKNYHYDSFNTSDISPIPLTEDILLKCGAYVSTGTTGPLYTFDNIPALEIFYSETDQCYSCTYGDRLLAEINNLHQLQNLIYCITGEELNVEL